MVADAESDVTGEKVIGVPGVFGTCLLILTLILFPHEAIVLNVIDRLQDDVSSENVSQIKQRSMQPGNQIKTQQQRCLANRVDEHFVL